MPIRVLHVGLGPIGAAIVKRVAAHQGTTVAGGVDVDPAKVGRDIGEVIGGRHRFGLTVTRDLAATLKSVRPDVAVVAAHSSLRQSWPVLQAILRARVPIVSTTEELVYPVKAQAALAKKIDAAAKRARVAVFGVGVNPGFVMDTLPIALSSVCASVSSIEVDRVQDARIRRAPFQRKIGAGLTTDEFHAAVKEGVVRHVGLPESVSMIADAMAWRLDRITEDIQPVVADQTLESAIGLIEAGRVSGVVQQAHGFRKGRALIRLHMAASIGATDTYDAIRIAGVPPVSVRIDGGIHGDIATAAIVVNALPAVIEADPGLRTPRDMILPSLFASTRR